MTRDAYVRAVRAVQEPDQITLDFFEVWSKALDRALQGLDLKDPDDRSIFRMRVEKGFKNARVGVPRDIAVALGAKAKSNSHLGWSRAVADAYIAGKRIKTARSVTAAYFNVGDDILYGRYKNKRGRVLRIYTDHRGVPTVEIEPVPKGRKSNVTMSLFKIWSEREMAKSKAEQQSKTAARVLRAWRACSSSLGRGDTYENGMLRIHRYADHFRVWDLTNAGKRGKKVDVLLVLPSDQDWMINVSKELTKYTNYKDVVAFFESQSEHAKLRAETERGVDVTPAGFKPIRIEGKGVLIEVEYKYFSVRDQDDQHNLPTCIPASKGGLKSIPVFYRWVQDNESAIKRMSYRDVLLEMNKLDIKYHSYCAMD